MPRPCKRRRICEMPSCSNFGPQGAADEQRQTVVMTLDEYETIRLIDLEGLTQEQCARQMNVSRTTAQAIYNSARVKLAQCLVYERELRITGGDYVLCDEAGERCSCPHRGCMRCCKTQNNMEEKQ